MYASERVLYPMVGVGAFFALFWTGFVVAWELGLPCVATLIVAVACACAGAWAVARAQARDAGPARPPVPLASARGRVPSTGPARPRRLARAG